MYKYTTDQTRYVITFPFLVYLCINTIRTFSHCSLNYVWDSTDIMAWLKKQRTLERGAVTFPSIPDFSICRHS